MESFFNIKKIQGKSLHSLWEKLPFNWGCVFLSVSRSFSGSPSCSSVPPLAQTTMVADSPWSFVCITHLLWKVFLWDSYAVFNFFLTLQKKNKKIKNCVHWLPGMRSPMAWQMKRKARTNEREQSMCKNLHIAEWFDWGWKRCESHGLRNIKLVKQLWEILDQSARQHSWYTANIKLGGR